MLVLVTVGLCKLPAMLGQGAGGIYGDSRDGIFDDSRKGVDIHEPMVLRVMEDHRDNRGTILAAAITDSWKQVVKGSSQARCAIPHLAITSEPEYAHVHWPKYVMATFPRPFPTPSQKASADIFFFPRCVIKHTYQYSIRTWQINTYAVAVRSIAKCLSLDGTAA